MDMFDIDLDIDLEGFDLDGNSGKVNNRYCLPRAHKNAQNYAVKYDNAVKFISDFADDILLGVRVDAVLSGNFIFGDIFEALAVSKNILIDDITLSTLSISKNNVDSFHNLLVGDYCRSLNIIVSDYFWSHNRQNAPYIYEQLDINDMFQFAVAGTHTKISLVKIGDKKIVIKGSANLRSSVCVEEISIETNSDLYDFHKQWHDAILDKYSTIKKAVRASKLFDMITKGTERKLSWLSHQKDMKTG